MPGYCGENTRGLIAIHTAYLNHMIVLEKEVALCILELDTVWTPR